MPMKSKQQPEKRHSLPPVIAIPADIDPDYRERLQGLKNGKIVEQGDHPYIDVGDGTLAHVQDARSLLSGVTDGSLIARLTDLAKRCEYPVMIIVGNLYGKSPVDIAHSRSIAGFLTHLELFTRIRTLQAPDRFHAVMMMQLLAKQAQRGFQSFGLEDL